MDSEEDMYEIEMTGPARRTDSDESVAVQRSHFGPKCWTNKVTDKVTLQQQGQGQPIQYRPVSRKEAGMQASV